MRPRTCAPRWALEGPTNIGGHLVDLVVDRTQADSVYVAAATGGVWRSTDAGATLEQAWPDDASQSMGAIAARAPTAPIRAGTGELNPGGGSITFGGTGIYVSKNGGNSWRRRGLQNSGTTGRIVTNPTNPDVAYVAAGGSLFNAGGQRGIYKTTNGGRTWDQVLAPETPFTGGADLVMDPRNPLRLYAAMWDHRREPDVHASAASSPACSPDNGGETWKRLWNVVTKTSRATPRAWSPTPASAASASRSLRATPTGSTSSPPRRSARTRASTCPTTPASRSIPVRCPARRAASAGGSAASGSTRPTRTTCSWRA